MWELMENVRIRMSGSASVSSGTVTIGCLPRAPKTLVKIGVSIDLGGFNKSSRNNSAILLMGFYDVINKMFSHNTQVLSTLFSPFHRANSENIH